MSGKGTRFILANTEQLHDKIQEMSDRIRQLEDSIRVSNTDSPLLAPELMVVKSTMGLYSSTGPPTGQEGSKKANGTTQEISIVPADRTVHDDTAMRVDGPSCIVQSVRHTAPMCDPN